ncbi:adenosinetriphosphatase [Phakopsora pachyrhizi]|nr:adenosinetriphosphatase [Phakopsora pachyrhizi]
MSLRNILNHPPSPMVSAAPSSTISPHSPSSSNSAKPQPAHEFSGKLLETRQNAASSSSSKPPPRHTKRYLDKILDSDAFDDLQAEGLPPMSQHPYPEPEGYSSSDGMDLDDFAEVWSEPLNKYMVSSRRKEKALEKGFEDWELSKMQETAARVTTWAGERAEQILKQKRARIEQRRRLKEEKLKQERLWVMEQAERAEREQANEDKKRRKREQALAAKERNREKRRVAKEEEQTRKRAELAEAKASAIRAQAEALEAVRAEAEEAKARQQMEISRAVDLKKSRLEWGDEPSRTQAGQKLSWTQSNSINRRSQFPDANYQHISAGNLEVVSNDVNKSRAPSNLANLLNSPRGLPSDIAPPRSSSRGSRIQPNNSAGASVKRKRTSVEASVRNPADESLTTDDYADNCQTAHDLPPYAMEIGFSSVGKPPGLNSQLTRRVVSGIPIRSVSGKGKTTRGVVSSNVDAISPSNQASLSALQPLDRASAELKSGSDDDALKDHKVIDPATRRLQNRCLPAWGHDLPYGTEPYASFPDQLDFSLPIRERTAANPKVLANKRWDAIEEARRQVWISIARKDIPKVIKVQQNATQSRIGYSKRLSALVSREARRILTRTKASKEVQIRAKRLMRELLVYYRGNEKRERETKRRADREAVERAKKDDEMREVKRQARKLNFLITQTELYSHFVGNKIKTKEAEESDETAGAAPIAAVNEKAPKVSTITGASVEISGLEEVASGNQALTDINFDDEDESNLQVHAARNALKAVDAAKQRAQAFDSATAAEKLAITTADTVEGSQQKTTGIDIDRDDLNFQNPTMAGDIQVKQPKMLMAELKEYQLKGLNWLANLYEQGINGILADEMGLGKTVQSISLMAYLAEVHNIWGPFLVIAPASTLHNWQQEITRFVPALKALPYWGSVKDRTILRKFWNRKHLRYDRDAPFHVVVTSYQLVVQDEKYFQTLKWQYMILDEAQAIKSSSSTRWKTLLGFHCRNRLLLTGTPIQNSMTELWALLHFIMPQLFDSHEEFSEWFSKDIENSVDKAGGMNEHQLRRLHMILKPFMLRRIKKNVQNELGDKIEIDVACGLTPRQKLMYGRLRENVSIADLVQKATSLSNDDATVKRLMNLIMQFRKVCNHPELFERADVKAPLSFLSFNFTANVARDGDLLDCAYSNRSVIQFTIPKVFYREGGMLSVPGHSSRAGFETMYLHRLMNIWSIPNVMEASPDGLSVPSWAKLLGFSVGDVQKAAHAHSAIRIPWLLSRLYQARELAQASSLQGSVAEELQTTAFFAKSDILPRAQAEPGTPYLYEIFQDVRSSSRITRADVQIQSVAVVAPPAELYSLDPSLQFEQFSIKFDPVARSALFGLRPAALESKNSCDQYKSIFSNFNPRGMIGVSSENDLPRSFMQVPQLEKLMLDSGKLARLDSLLKELKTGGHRVLIYFQMTRMIDLMEEYLSFRHYRYLRLDGSSTISERRDMVMDWQNRPEIFIFLLSTRAGGLGINLTAADTVIFYDCDWNPSNDQQAMDRAHRLGQKRQVTVYRLITSGTIDERILKLARTKKTVQDAVVGSSSGTTIDATGEGAKPNEVVSLLLDEEELEAGLRAQAAKREALKEKQVQSGLRGVRLREERKAALAANHQSPMDSVSGWGTDGLNLDDDDDEEAFGFFTNTKRAEDANLEVKNGGKINNEVGEKCAAQNKGKKRKTSPSIEEAEGGKSQNSGIGSKTASKKAKGSTSNKNAAIRKIS